MLKKKTKIICTIGPASDSEDMLKRLALAGMDVARLNFSHGTHEEQLKRIETIRKINNDLEFPVAILQDTKGPEIRTGKFKGKKVQVVEGTEVLVHMNEILGDATNFSITYSNLINEVEIGQKILVDDGYLVLVVKSLDKKNNVIVTEAQNTHVCKDTRGINVPNIHLSLPFISEKDRKDIEFACDNNLDFIAASFVNSKDDVLAIREILKEKGNDRIRIIAKIENQTGVNNLDEILEVSDGVMVARGDLGVEVNVEYVPRIQRMMIEKAHIQRKIVITATQMMESMIENVTPTRAEVSDIANAVLDGTDAIMLSAETAVGKHPELVVQMMAKVAATIEPSINTKKMIERVKLKPRNHRNARAIAESIAYTVQALPIVAVISLSKTGYTARLMSSYRLKAPVLALVENKDVARSLALSFGVYPYVLDEQLDNFERAAKIGVDHIMRYKDEIQDLGDRVIVTAGLPFGQTSSQTNTMQIIKFKDDEKWLEEWNS